MRQGSCPVLDWVGYQVYSVVLPALTTYLVGDTVCCHKQLMLALAGTGQQHQINVARHLVRSPITNVKALGTVRQVAFNNNKYLKLYFVTQILALHNIAQYIYTHTHTHTLTNILFQWLLEIPVSL